MQPPLSNDAARVLRILVDRNIVVGGDLMRLSGMKTPGELAKPVKELQERRLIEVGSGFWDDSTLPFATLAVRPSAKEYLNRLMS